MPKLYLLRHAQAAGSYELNDHERPLTPHGIQQATNIQSSLPTINLAICSAAQRTKMTLQELEKAGTNIQKTIYSDDVYNAPAGALLTAIQNCDKEENLLLIAHNPGIHQLANILANEDNCKIREILRYNYAPATLAIIECPIKKWTDIQPAQNTITDLIIPD